MEKALRRKSPPYFGLPKPLASKETRLSDEEVFCAVNCDKVPPGVRSGIEKKDFGAAARGWASYITRRSDRPLPDPRLTRPLRDRDLLREADLIRRHKIIAWGFRRTSFGDEINFVTFAAEHRLVEFHHLAFLTYLASAYTLMRSSEPVKAFEDIVCQHYRQQDRVRATTAGHPLWNNRGCGIRVMSLIHPYLVMKSSGAFSPGFHTTMLKMVLGYSRWLYRAQEECRPGCEAFDACTALVLAGSCFPEFNEAEEWLKRGIDRIGLKIDKECFDNGFYAELADECALGVLDRLVYVLEVLLARDLRRHLPPGYEKKVGGYAEYFARTCTPLGMTNTFNDSAHLDLTDRLDKWAELFKRTDLRYPVRELLPADTRRKARKPSWDPSLNVPESGRAVMRGDWGKDALYMSVEYGGADRHSHHETTNFAVFAYGKPLMIDRGRGTTHDDPYHLFLRTSRLHSMVTVGEENIDLNAKRAAVGTWHSGDLFDCLILTHNGYKKKFNAEIRRTIIFIKPKYWIVSDIVMHPRKSVKAVSYIHSLPVLVVLGNGNICCKKPPGILVAAPMGERMEFVKERAVANMACIDTEMQWTDWVGYEKRAKAGKGVTFMMVLYPYKDEVPDVSVRRIDVLPLKGKKPVDPTTAEAFEIATPDGTDIVAISHGRSAKRRYGPLVCDGRLCVLRCDSQGTPGSYLLVDATTLQLNGKSLHKAKKAPAAVEKSLRS